jgi:predicted AlkP superfamily pyrophosphatase or phosphodiesterase
MPSLKFITLLFFTAFLPASEVKDKKPHYKTPKLVVGIVIDQMRYDYLHRYWDKYGEDGFKKILNGGFSFDHAKFNYAPTFTGPGHASVFTGTTPSIHGIIENRWYSRDWNRTTYVTEDEAFETVGSETDEGKMSPRYLMTTTIGDELRLHTNMRSKVVGISLKDRGSILPAGHSGDAYWFDYESGTFITSTYYHDELPDWMKEFNEENLTDKFLSSPWESLLPLEEYTESAELNEDSAAFPGQQRSGLPHNLPEIVKETGPGVIAETPFGDAILTELAKAAIEGESLGEGGFTDMLAIGFSSTDHVGHRFGPSSREVQDTYLRLDRHLADLINYLDDRIGMDDVLIFLTSDHGAAHMPSYLEQFNIPSGYLDEREAGAKLRDYLEKKYGFDPVAAYRRFQVYLDRDEIHKRGLSLEEVQKTTARFLPEVDGIAGAITSESIRMTDFSEGIRTVIQRGYYPNRSGDVLYWTDPQWMETRRSGTTHGAPYSYDTRAPLLWYGWNISAGRTTVPVYITDIASTVANFINVPYPNGNIGNPMNHLMKKD